MTALLTTAITSTPLHTGGETATGEHCEPTGTPTASRRAQLKRLLLDAFYSLSVRHPSPSDRALRDMSPTARGRH